MAPTTPLSPALFIATASGLVASDAITPLRPGRVDFDPLHRDYHGPRDHITTAAFIGHVGFWAHRRPGGTSSWPFPVDADSDELVRLADSRGVLSVGTPERGALYMRWSLLEQRFTRASIVLWGEEVLPAGGAGWSYDCLVVEGSVVRQRVVAPDDQTNASGREAVVKWARCARVRCCPALGDRFISWVDLDSRNELERVEPRRAA